MKILLMCSAGMSTSLLEKKMKDYSDQNNLGVEVDAKASFEGMSSISEYDVILLGPQVRYLLAEAREKAGTVPVDVIPAPIYALANGEKAIEFAKKLMENK
jgi:cellobiose PTS system EIIB component